METEAPKGALVRANKNKLMWDTLRWANFTKEFRISFFEDFDGMVTHHTSGEESVHGIHQGEK